MPKFCPDCGRQHPDDAVKCTDCGLRLVKGNAPETVLLDSRYEILDVVKSGAMGCVYRGLDTRLGNIVAVKKMLIPHSPANRERFLREAKILSQLHHGGLPNVTDFFVAHDPETREISHFLVMTFIDGKDLETIIEEEKKPLPLETVLDYFYRILEILSYLHSQEPPVIYRDIKPSNIMISKGKIFLVDFGIARLFTGEEKGTVVGTPGYAAPEQYRGFADAKSDIYSLGVVVHYLLTGKDPADFEAAPFKFDSIRKYNMDVSEEFDSLIQSMLDVVPENRPESVEKIMEMMGFSRESLSAGSNRNEDIFSDMGGIPEKLTTKAGRSVISGGSISAGTEPGGSPSGSTSGKKDEASKFLVPLSVLFLFIVILFPIMMNRGCYQEYPPHPVPTVSPIPSPSVTPTPLIILIPPITPTPSVIPTPPVTPTPAPSVMP